MLRKNLSAGLLLLALTACTKEKIVEVEKIVGVEKPNPVNITITSPKPTDEYAYGDTVRIKALLTGVNTLHGYELSVRNSDHHDEVIYLNSVHAHDKVLNVDTFWLNTQRGEGTRSINILASIDHDGNVSGKKVYFAVK